MSVRRRITDSDWAGAHQREPWDGPSSAWGEDVNTRLDALEIKQDELLTALQENTRLTNELMLFFRHTKKVGIGVIGVLAFLGYSGILAIWDWLQKHIR